jgi:colanic acid/amylovoran biosynthesis glycosyltransferase
MKCGPQEITYFTGAFLPASEVFMVEQSRHLKRYTSSFIASTKHNSKSARQYSTRVQYLEGSARGRLAEIGLKAFRWADPVFRRLTKETALLHAQFGKNGYVAWPIARSTGLPFLTTFHGFDATFSGNPANVPGINQRLFFWRGRAAMARAGLNCIAVSDYIRRRLIELGFSENRVLRHYIGIDPDLFAPSVDVVRVRHRVVCVARFVEYKGHRFILDALAQLRKSGIPIEFIMVGDGPLRSEIERSARKRIEKVQVIDNQSQQEIVSLLQSAKLYIHGSYQTPDGHAEALGLSVLEAQAVGTPVVAFDSGGVGEAVLNGKSGYLAAEKSSTSMAEMVGALLSDDDQWRSFSQSGIRFVRSNFDIRKCTVELEDTYDRVIRAHRNASAPRSKRD